MRRGSIEGFASLTDGGTLNLSAPIDGGVRSAAFTLSQGRRRAISLPTTIRSTYAGSCWAESTVFLAAAARPDVDVAAVPRGVWEVLLTTKAGLSSTTCRIEAPTRSAASMLESPTRDPQLVAVSLASDEAGLTVVVDEAPVHPQVISVDVGFTDVVVTGTLVDGRPPVSSVIARRNGDKREVVMQWEADTHTFRASAPVASMAASEGVWEVLIVDGAGRQHVRRGLPEGRDRRYDISTPVSVVAFDGGLARVRGYCARDGRVRMSIVPLSGVT